MNFLNLHTDFLRSSEYLGAEPVERATWLNLAAWCATQENGGRIEGAESWNDRKFQQVCGVTKAEVELSSDLYGFENGSLVVNFYPIEQEAKVRQKRENGAKGGRPPKDEPPEGKPPGKPPRKPGPKPTGNLPVSEDETTPETEGSISGETKGKGMEGKEKGMEGKEREMKGPPPHSLARFTQLNVFQAIREVYPSSPHSFSKPELSSFYDNEEIVRELTEDDFEILRIWTHEADDKARGCRLWPSNRSQFLKTPGEAIEKVRGWWGRSGRKWWTSKQETKRKREARLAAEQSEGESGDQMTRAEALEFLKDKSA